jgi:hypothetical protein
MINAKEHPVEWVMLNNGINDVIEHLQSLSREMNRDSDFDEIEFRIHLNHIYAHLNRLWNSRNHIGHLSEADFERYSQYPAEIEVIS